MNVSLLILLVGVVVLAMYFLIRSKAATVAPVPTKTPVKVVNGLKIPIGETSLTNAQTDAQGLAQEMANHAKANSIISTFSDDTGNVAIVKVQTPIASGGYSSILFDTGNYSGVCPVVLKGNEVMAI